ncbi:MAG: glycosyltransferase family 4 protein [Candidatus Dormibacteraeota bacterium]|nr:glycosyltransferase family 4 protein [Candidatus Dormibacteraeota bacterium]
MTYESPNLAHGGGAIRQAHLLDAVARRVDTHLLVAERLSDEGLRSRLSGVTELAMELPIHGSAVGGVRRRAASLGHALFSREPLDVEADAAWRAGLGPALEAIVEGFDVVHLEHPGLAPLMRRRGSDAWALTFQNLPSRRAEQQLEITAGSRQRWFVRREASKARAFEAWAGRSFDRVFVSSPEDASALQGQVEVVPNGVDVAAYLPSPLPSEPRIVLSASLFYLPNVEGALWFCEHVWPRVLRQVPRARLDIAGRAPLPEVLALGSHEGVEVHPDVPRMQPFLAAARLAVVPVRIGSGTRLKALEAMASGRPVVGTRVGLEGLGIGDGVEAAVRDDPAAMAEAIVELLGDDSLSATMGAAGRQLVENCFSWDILGERFAQALLDLGSGEPVRRPVGEVRVGEQ